MPGELPPGLEEPAYPDDLSHPPRRPRDWAFAALLFFFGIVAVNRALFALAICRVSNSGCGALTDSILLWTFLLSGPALFVGGTVVLLRPRRSKS